MERRFVRPAELGSLVHAVFGSDRRLVHLDRFSVATKKGVYRLTLDDAMTAVLYVWHPDENYWPDRAGTGEQFGDPCGLDAYVACKARYDEAGARTAETIVADRTHAHYPADLAIVEDLPGGTLDELLERDPDAAASALHEVSAYLDGMRSLHSTQHGRVAHIAAGTAVQGQPSQDVAFEQAVRNLDEAAESVPEIAAVRDQLSDRLRERLARIEPRAYYSLVHGELGGDHVMLDRSRHPVIVDLEGTNFTDVEAEHVFTRMGFGTAYEALRPDGLDEARMSFYELALHLSLVAGPMRMVAGDYPGSEFMREIAIANTKSVLTAV